MMFIDLGLSYKQHRLSRVSGTAVDNTLCDNGVGDNSVRNNYAV